MILNESDDIIVGVDGTEDEYIELLQSVIDTDREQLTRDDLTPFLRAFFEDRIADYEQRINNYKKENKTLSEDISNKHIEMARRELEENPNCFCVLYGYRYKNFDSAEIAPEVFYTESEYKTRVEEMVRAFDRYFEKRTILAKESDFQFYALYNNKINESIEFEQETSSEKRIVYKGFYIVQFDMSWQYKDKEWLDNGVVICLKNASDKNGFDVVVYAEDEDGNDINFKSIQDAKDWIDKYSDRIVFKIKHDDEIHATIESDETL